MGSGLTETARGLPVATESARSRVIMPLPVSPMAARIETTPKGTEPSMRKRCSGAIAGVAAGMPVGEVQRALRGPDGLAPGARDERWDIHALGHRVGRVPLLGLVGGQGLRTETDTAPAASTAWAAASA